ncbi:MAG: hypothetical protein K2X38_17995 [Gemmataceae bacterium]|nr:hypothetical protein [Gemmataceae bacterium]
MRRLDFSLPEFTRLSWVSDPARAVWEPRVRRIVAAWPGIESAAVAAGLRRCCLLTLTPQDVSARLGEWNRLGLSAVTLRGASASPGNGETGMEPESLVALAVGTPRELTHFLDAWEAADHDRLADLLGFPPCCRQFHRLVCVGEALEDPIWSMALASVPVAEDGRVVEVTGSPSSNPLWRRLGVRAVPHLPCRFDCTATVELADALAARGRAAGYAVELDWLLEILDWPVEWSALHGIAEIKTPLLRVSTQTDATAEKYVVRRLGNGYPAEGARGIHFPFRPARQSLATLSVGFRAGLANPIRTIEPAPPEDEGTATPRTTVLHETFEYLRQCPGVGERTLRTVRLNQYFTVAEMDDGSIGAAMSYYSLKRVRHVQDEIAARLADEPLLAGVLFAAGGPPSRWDVPEGQWRLLADSLRTAILSALSAPFLRAGGDAAFNAVAPPPHDLFAGARRALVIGFGGYMDRLARADHVEELHVHDLGYGAGRPDMEAAFAEYRKAHPRKRFVLSDGHDTRERLREVDLVAITGSALCNGTIDQLLLWAQPCPRIVVQGQSAAVHPKVLFARGVHVVSTTLKPRDLIDLAAADPSGRAMRPLLEGGLPPIHLTPRGSGAAPKAKTDANLADTRGGAG